VPAGIDTWLGREPCTEQEREHHAEPRGTFWLVTIMRRASAFVLSAHSRGSGRRSKLSSAKRHLVEPTRIRPGRASKVGRGGSRAPTMSAVIARNILDGILYLDKL
jgi:hypothetical protein